MKMKSIFINRSGIGGTSKTQAPLDVTVRGDITQVYEVDGQEATHNFDLQGWSYHLFQIR